MGVATALVTSKTAAPRGTLSTIDGVVLVVGMMVGIGIFASPALVAQFAGSGINYLACWLIGGLLTLIGALCYAELATSFPDAGGEYNFLSRAYGRPVGLMFAWARCTVIQTGAIALVAFVYGDYAQAVLPLGPYGPAIHAGIIVVIFTAINVAGTAQGKVAQQIFTLTDISALLMIIAAGLVIALSTGVAAPATPAPSTAGETSYGLVGLAMVFVLLTYGGWNEASYISAELRGGTRDMVRVLTFSVIFVTIIYFLVASVYLYVLGFENLQKSQAVAADVMRAAFGPIGATLLSMFVCGAAISTLNATIFTGARVFYALGRDLPALRLFGIWSPRGENPANAFILQGLIALALVGLGALMRDGFKAMVEYTSPVFWLFMTLIGVSIFVFRRRNPDHVRPYRVPFYPLFPIIFIATCLWMLYSSLVYTGAGALFGVIVLALGAPLLLVSRASKPAPDPAE
jgi:basic amino acid/polyamine antiporter, APA family